MSAASLRCVGKDVISFITDRVLCARPDKQWSLNKHSERMNGRKGGMTFKATAAGSVADLPCFAPSQAAMPHLLCTPGVNSGAHG